MKSSNGWVLWLYYRTFLSVGGQWPLSSCIPVIFLTTDLIGPYGKDESL